MAARHSRKSSAVLPNKRRRIEADRIGHFQKLDHVQATLALFVFRDEGLRPGKTPRERRLSKTSLLAPIREEGTEAFVSPSMNGLGHRIAAPLRPAIR